MALPRSLHFFMCPPLSFWRLPSLGTLAFAAVLPSLRAEDNLEGEAASSPHWFDLVLDSTDIAPLIFPLWVALGGALVALAWQRRSVSRLNRQTADLHASQLQLSLVFDASQDGFWDLDLRTGHVLRSPRWLEMLGFTADEFPATLDGFLALIHPEDAKSVTAAMEAISDPAHPTFGRVEYRIKDRKGSWRWLLDRAKIVSRDAHRRPLRIVGTGSDITVRKRMEESLRRSETLFRQSQEVSGVGGWELDVATETLFWTHETFRIHDLDPSGESPPLEEAVRFYPPASQIVLRAALERARSSGDSFDLELELKTARQRTVWVRTIGRTERDAVGRIGKVYGSFQDISARKTDDASKEDFQNKLLETQKLESLGVLAGGVAHDFNNLLTAILANAQLCRLSSVEGGEVDERLASIEKASFKAADLCHQLLAYAGRNPMLRRKSELNELVRETVQLLELSVGKNAQLELELSPHSPEIEADRAQMSQVMMNLVINAAEALPAHGGTIRIRTGSAWMTEDMLSRACIGQKLPPSRYAFLEVTDTGCGMTPETMARIFDPFFTTKFTGRGLGLAAVLGIVRGHKGGFFVESVLGEGSTFRMCLPMLDLPAQTAVSFEPPASGETLLQWNSTRALVVDDEASVRNVTAEMLRRAGCTVETACDGIEAVETFRSRTTEFDIVVLDLTMPGMDGVTAMRLIRELRADMPILLMSGYTEQEPALAGLLTDANMFMRKPFTRENLLEKINHLITNESTV